MEKTVNETGAAAEETLGRLAAVCCEGEEATVDEVRAALAACIDQTLLDPCAGPEQVAAWARANAHEGFAALCVQPCNVARVAWELGQLQSATATCCMLSFPQGQDAPEALCFEAALALAAGAGEIELVANLGAFLEGSLEDVAAPVQAVLGTIETDLDEDDDCGDDCGCDDDCGCGEHDDCGCGEHDDCGCGEHDDCGCDGLEDDEDAEGTWVKYRQLEDGSWVACEDEDDGAWFDDACDDDCDDDCDEEHDHHDHEREALLKVVLEAGLLAPDQLCRATDLVSSLDVDYVAACTGFGPRGASADDVRLMCATAEPGVQVKATGDVRTLDEALALLEAGAVRLGTTHGAEILAEFDALAAQLEA